MTADYKFQMCPTEPKTVIGLQNKVHITNDDCECKYFK